MCLSVCLHAAFLKQLELQGLATSQDICGIISSSRLDEMQWCRLPAGGPPGGGGAPRGARRVNELQVKERTKRKFTLTVHNAAREHIALYARLHSLLLEFVLQQVGLVAERDKPTAISIHMSLETDIC